MDLTSRSANVAPVLVIGVGNPSRGDDALGPLLVDRIDALELPGVACLTDFQLQVEHALDLVGRERVVFVDATVEGDLPFVLSALAPCRDASATTHALSPAAVLHTYVAITDSAPPASHLLAIRGHRFDLGTELSDDAGRNLDAAFAALVPLLAGATRAAPAHDPRPAAADRATPGAGG